MLIRKLLSAMITLFAAGPCLTQTDVPVPNAQGYITRVASPSIFDIDGRHVVLTPACRAGLRSAKGVSAVAFDRINPYVGEAAKAYGKYDHKTHTVEAVQIELTEMESHEVSGFGVIDALLPPPTHGAPMNRLVRADGYPVLLTTKTTITYAQPLSSTSPITANLWIRFHGVQRSDGIVVADTAKMTQNFVSDGEDKLRTKKEYDPAAVNSEAHQSALSRTFLGIDPKKIPPTKDTTMQAHVSEIGSRLIPQYQRDLPDADNTKIEFRFQVVEEKKWSDAMTLPNGIILIPHRVVERMQNDSQLAAVLADNIATALEKQELHAQPAMRTMSGTQIAGAVGGIFVPGLSLATDAGTGIAAHKILVEHEEQSGRVSLGLLHDAGFDLQEAPKAWWILATKQGKDLADKNPPRRAIYLYKMLGTTWHPQQTVQGVPNIIGSSDEASAAK